MEPAADEAAANGAAALGDARIKDNVDKYNALWDVTVDDHVDKQSGRGCRLSGRLPFRRPPLGTQQEALLPVSTRTTPGREARLLN